jgi:hypothetical protein
MAGRCNADVVNPHFSLRSIVFARTAGEFGDELKCYANARARQGYVATSRLRSCLRTSKACVHAGYITTVSTDAATQWDPPGSEQQPPEPCTTSNEQEDLATTQRFEL